MEFNRDIFKVNKYITLKLENGLINIYIKRKLFKTQSINEVSETQINNNNRSPVSISFDTIFWRYCSNLQSWFKSNYDTRLLHISLSFPLLKKLTEVGDPIAKRVFKEEISKIFESNHPQTTEYIINEGYLDSLNYEELNSLLENLNFNIRSSEDLIAIINSGSLANLSRLELLYFSKNHSFSISHIDIQFLEKFFNLFEQEFLINFILSNKSILENMFFPLIKKISKGNERIRSFFLEELNNKIKSSTMYNFEILKLFQEIFIVGYKKQSFLDEF